jgi:membrane-associated PAP2 superfamily phosphatase
MKQTMHDRTRTDLVVSLALLAMLLWWEASGWDMVVAQWYGDGAGFALRNRWWTRGLIHDGGRVLSGLALAASVVFAVRASAGARHVRLAWFGLVLACLLLVPTIKQFSHTSCPWDLEEFGGTVPYVPHWMLTVLDGGPGRCFPSGHAVAAFAFLPLYFQWRNTHPRLARAILVLVLGVGLLFGWAQLVRGAHFPSHTLWSGWLCWVVGAVGARWLDPVPALVDLPARAMDLSTVPTGLAAVEVSAGNDAAGGAKPALTP